MRSGGWARRPLAICRWLAAAIIVAAAPAGAGQPVTTVFRDGVSPTTAYRGTRDTSLDELGDRPWDPGSHHGLGDGWVGGPPFAMVGLLRFDLSALAATATVESVSLTLQVTNGTQANYQVYEVLRPWSSDEADWTRATASSSWGAPGAQAPSDHGPATLATLTGGVGARTLTFTPAGVGTVQAWVAGTRPNYGLALLGMSDSDVARWVASEGQDAASRPRLVVVHSGGTVASFQNGIAPSASYAGTADTTLANNAPPAADRLRIEGADGPNAAALISFDLGAIPAGAVVRSVALALRVGNTSAHAYPIYAVQRDWTEAATWLTADGSTPWQVPGALGPSDRGSASLGALGPTSSAGITEVPLNAEGVAVVQAWVSGSRPNQGFLLQDYAADDGTDAKSREDGDAQERPGLSVTWLEVGTAAVTPLEQVVAPGDGVWLDASGSRAPSGETLAEYLWYQPEGPQGARLPSAATQAFVLEEPGDYVFTVAVRDSGGGVSAPARARVRVSGEVFHPRSTLGCATAAPQGSRLDWSGVAWLLAALTRWTHRRRLAGAQSAGAGERERPTVRGWAARPPRRPRPRREPRPSGESRCRSATSRRGGCGPRRSSARCPCRTSPQREPAGARRAPDRAPAW